MARQTGRADVPAARRRSVSSTSTNPRLRAARVSRTDAPNRPSAPREEPLLGRHEPELVASRAHLRRQQIGEGVSEDALRRAVAIQLIRGEPVRELNKAMVQERNPAFERVGHRVAVLVPEELGQAALGEDDVVLAAQPVGQCRGSARQRRPPCPALAGRGGRPGLPGRGAPAPTSGRVPEAQG